MSRVTVDTEALEKAAQALTVYIGSVQNSIKIMQDAAIDCRDNMGNDRLSQKAISNLSSCVKTISSTLSDAEELRKQIVNKKSEIENLESGF